MRWRRAQTTAAAALTLLVVGALAWLLSIRTSSAPDPAPSPVAAPAAAHPAAPGLSGAPAPAAAPAGSSTVDATVDAGPLGSALPAGFLGLSLEYSALDAYTGASPAAPDPVFVQLLRNLAPAPGQPIVLRIGGNSTDATWWPVQGQSRPGGVSYTLTPSWLAGARALAGTLGARLILGVNLAAGQPRLAGAEASALLRGVGSGHVIALELGNEPDVYGVFPWYTGSHGLAFARGVGYGLTRFIGDARRWAEALPAVPLAGPAVATLSWMSGLPALLNAVPGLRVVTVHRYPLQGCLTGRASPSYPSIANLLSDRSSQGLARALAPSVALAHSHGLPFRVDELNSAALAGCLDRAGVSNTFASALWMLDTLFNMASVGVDGVNVHTLPGAGYEPFTFSRSPAGGWQAHVHPDYYGMLMFAQAFPAGAQLLPVHAPAGPVKVWATGTPDGQARVTLINEDGRPHLVELQLPPAEGRAELEWLRGPGPAATGGVTLGGQTFGPETPTGRLPAPRLAPLGQLFGSYSIDMPAYTAALLTR